MRYSQDKEKSAELLRLVLPLMARQSAAFHPLSYALWYEHVSGINPALTQVLEKKLVGDAPLTDDEVYRLHAQHIVARDVEALERLQDQLRILLAETARTAADAGAEAGQFGDAPRIQRRSWRTPQQREGPGTSSRAAQRDRAHPGSHQGAVRAPRGERRAGEHADGQARARQDRSSLDPLTGLRANRARPQGARGASVSGRHGAARHGAARRGHRSLQADQRHVRAPARRQGDPRGRPGAALEHQGQGHVGPHRRRGVRRAPARHHSRRREVAGGADPGRRGPRPHPSRREGRDHRQRHALHRRGRGRSGGNARAGVRARRADAALYEAKRTGRNRVCAVQPARSRPGAVY